MPKKFENIQALRGISVLLVVFCHLQIVERKYGLKEMILPDWLDHGIVSVDLFFAVSGFVIATVTHGQFQSLRAARHFFIQRITRIYPLYWFYSTIVLILWLYRPEMVNSAQGNQVNILSSFLLLPEDLLPLIMVGWTLIHEMYFYIVIAFFMPIVPERAFPFLLALWALVVIIGKSYCMVNPDEHYDPAIQLVFDPLTLDFIGGAAIALFLCCNIHKNGQLMMGMGIGAFLFFTIWPNSNSHLALEVFLNNFSEYFHVVSMASVKIVLCYQWVGVDFFESAPIR